MSTIQLKVNSRKDKDGKEYFEGTVTLSGVRPTKLSRNDGETRYDSRSSLMTAARNLAKRYGSELEVPETQKKAAKKSTRTHKENCSSPCQADN